MKSSLIILAFLIVSCTPPTSEVSNEELTNWMEWRSKRMTNLKSPDGFLNLAGLYWLQQGDNTFGSDSTNAIRFPSDLPKTLGNFQVSGKIVSLLSPIEGMIIDSLAASETVVFNY